MTTQQYVEPPPPNFLTAFHEWLKPQRVAMYNWMWSHATSHLVKRFVQPLLPYLVRK